LNDNNYRYLIHNVAIITNLNYDTIDGYFQELNSNNKIQNYVIKKTENSQWKNIKDSRCDFGIRFYYYCLIRSLKPKIIVENGVEFGFTSLVMCEALLKNIEDGFVGEYTGIDIDHNSGYLIQEKPYSSVGTVLYHDLFQFLNNYDKTIDFYYSDGFRSYNYELEEFRLLKSKLSKNAIVISNKLEFSDALSGLSRALNKNLIYFREHPAEHWYPGSHVGVMY